MVQLQVHRRIEQRTDGGNDAAKPQNISMLHGPSDSRWWVIPGMAGTARCRWMAAALIGSQR
jgi:hypothetical protein